MPSANSSQMVKLYAKIFHWCHTRVIYSFFHARNMLIIRNCVRMWTPYLILFKLVINYPFHIRTLILSCAQNMVFRWRDAAPDLKVFRRMSSFDCVAKNMDFSKRVSFYLTVSFYHSYWTPRDLRDDLQEAFRHLAEIAIRTEALKNTRTKSVETWSRSCLSCLLPVRAIGRQRMRF